MNKNKKIKYIAFASVLAIAASTMCMDGCKKNGAENGDGYTYNAYFQSSPSTWNPHTWESNTDSVILSYINIGLYDVQLTYDSDGNANGYEWICEMASAEPEDVTSSYIGKYGISAGDSAKAWRISLNESACWEDGSEITSDDYIYSMQQLLDPSMLNRRSDSYTGGTFTVYGAYNYLYSKSDYVYLSLSSQGYQSVSDAQSAGESVYINMWELWGLEGASDKDGNACPQWADITDTTLYRDYAVDEGNEGDWVSAEYVYKECLTYYGENSLIEDGLAIKVKNQNAGYEWDYKSDGTGGVGLLKEDKYTIVIILQDSVSQFNLKYNLMNNWLVNKDLYEKCKVATSSGLVSSTYCTSLNTTISYGPYKLKSYKVDESFELVKNPEWYGCSDGKHEGQFQTTDIYYRAITGQSSHETAMMKFMSGEIDDITILSSEMGSYGMSSYLLQTPQSFTYQFFLSTNAQELEKQDTSAENHSVLQLESFRKAISYSISRSEFCSAYSPASKPGFGILNYSYVSDPESGALYRDSDAAKKTSLLYNGFVANEDGTWSSRDKKTKYSSVDEAYNAITGYDPDYAEELYKEAYTQAIQKGIFKSGQKVVINLGTVGDPSSTYSAMVSTLNRMISSCLPEGTFNGVTIQIKSYAAESAYWAAVKSGAVDMAFAGWGGSAMDPWGIIYSSYINPDNSLNYGFDSLSKGIDVTVNVDGEDITASLFDWAYWLYNGQDDAVYIKINLYKKIGAVGEVSVELKTQALAACELAQLETSVNLPIYYSYTNTLKSAKYNNGSDVYINELIGYGGIRHMTYNYNNSEWASFVKKQGGNLENFYKQN